MEIENSDGMLVDELEDAWAHGCADEMSLEELKTLKDRFAARLAAGETMIQDDLDDVTLTIIDRQLTAEQA